MYFVGAGLSCAVGLPNTAQLIDRVLQLADDHSTWGVGRKVPDRLREAFEFFYPDGKHTDFRPDVSDFFATLTTYVDIVEEQRLPGTGFRGARGLYDDLKFAICHLLIERLREVDDTLKQGNAYLEEVVRPGNIVITSNWDVLLERYAHHHGVPLRHGGTSEEECVILKLHGSIDWLAIQNRPRHKNNRWKYRDADYSSLDERLCGPRPYTKALPTKLGSLIRVRGFEQLGTAWQRIKSRADHLHMVTMGTGKGARLGELEGTWEHAYNGISRARNLTIVGYSMPEDDIEIRTLLRAGTKRGGTPPEIVVRNPSPEVHNRIRAVLDREISSDYRAVDNA